MSKNLYVGNLSFDTTDESLRALFAQHGEVESAKVVSDRMTGRSRGFGFVEMASGGDEAIRALDGKEFEGRNLKVNVAKPRESKGGRW
jgi:cold-inducible RNA-binding protein